MSHSLRPFGLLLASVCVLHACGEPDPSSANNDDDAGEMGSPLADMELARDMDASRDMPSPDVDLPSDMASPDLSPMRDMTSLDMSSGDMTSDMTGPRARTLADYYLCQEDNDCPVGLGECIKEVALNRTDANGLDRVQLRALFPDLEPDQGVCSRLCTNGASACEGLQVDPNGDANAYTCQVVYTGAAPYPDPAPNLPFQGQLDLAELAAGQPFGALCRPPFQDSPAVDEGLCAPCVPGAQACSGRSLCWSFLNDAPAEMGENGQCMAPCDADDSCPMGFTCKEKLTAQGASFGKRCMPLLDTCTSCLDRDGDDVGTGFCGPARAPITGYDCDDRNADAYFDARTIDHPFPDFCGQFDYNCNGLSDDVEQVGTPLFGDDHCTACGDSCQGSVGTGASAGVQSCGTGTCLVNCNDPMAWADCDRDPSNGCETSVTDDTRLYYFDGDGDGRGDPNQVRFACDVAEVPAGYVSNALDCDDQNPAVYGGNASISEAPELCDDIDNDCDGQVDNNVVVENMSCTTTFPGLCSQGVRVCQLAANGSYDLECVPTIVPGQVQESCANPGVDDDCDGVVDDNPDDGALYFRDADADTFGLDNVTQRACSQPVGYAARGGDCNDSNSAINPLATEVCTTLADDDCDGGANDNDPQGAEDGTLWYQDMDNDKFPALAGPLKRCTRPVGYVARRSDSRWDCADSDATRYPGASETCNDGIDSNCTGGDNDLPAIGSMTYYLDTDGDSYGRSSGSIQACVSPGANYVTRGGDCADNAGQQSINPGAPESCDGQDNDCDTPSRRSDEGCPSSITTGTGSTEPWRGATSGDTTYTDDCPTGKGLVGYRLKWTNDRVRAIQLICRTIAYDRSTTSTPYTYTMTSRSQQDLSYRGNWSWYDNAFQHYQGELFCPNYTGSTFISGFKVRAGTELDGLEGLCKSVKLNVAEGLGQASSTITRGSRQDLGVKGGSGGGYYTEECQDDELATGLGLRMRYVYDAFNTRREYIIGIQLRCRKIDLARIN